MQLPDPLQPWRPWLDWFGPDLAPEIGRMLQRLSPLLGAFRGHRQAGLPEPDGLDDLRRRGPYERLLHSEWLLADELPDEFLRRAASGEHLFLSPRPRARRAERLIVALFDAGPLQLGAPRLAHVALWILLARRAAEAGAALRWGVLQAPGPLFAAADPADLRTLLKARSFTLAPAWSVWQAPLAEMAPAPGELWHIGAVPPETVAADPLQPSHVVTLRRAMDEDALEIGIVEGRRRRDARLTLPAAPLSVRVLTGGWLAPAAAPQAHLRVGQAFAIMRPPIVAPGGGHVAVALLGRTGFQLFTIPRTERKIVKPKPQQLPQSGEPLTLAVHGKTLGALVSTRGQLRFWQMGLPEVALPAPDTFQATTGKAKWLASVWVKTPKAFTRFYVLDDARRLVYWASGGAAGDDARGKCHLVATDVLGLAAAGGSGIAYARHEGDTIFGHVDFGHPGMAKKQRLGEVPAAMAVHVAQMGGSGILLSRGWAVSARGEPPDAEYWSLYCHPRFGHRGKTVEPERIVLLHGYSGVGLVPCPAGQRFALVVLAPDCRQIFLYRSQIEREAVYTSPAKIQKITVDGASGVIALLTEERQLVVYATQDKSLRLFLHSKGDGDDGTRG